MGGIFILLVAAATAVQFGWQPADSGGREYIIQVEPQLIDTFRKEGFSSDVPPQLRDIHRIRVVVGTGHVPHEGEMTPTDGDKTSAPPAKVTSAAKAHEVDGSRLAGIGDVEDPIPEAFIPKPAASKIDAAKTATAKTTARPSIAPKATIAAKVLTPDDPLPLPGPAVDRPDAATVQTDPAEPPLVPIVQPAPSVVKIEHPDRPIAKPESPSEPLLVQPTQDHPSTVAQPPIQPWDKRPATAAKEINAPPLISAAAGTGATPMAGPARATFATSDLPAANTKPWATDKPALAESDPPPDPTPDNRTGRHWGNGGNSTSDGTASAGGASGNDPFAQKASHRSPSEQSMDETIAAETPRPWFALLSAGALLAVSVAANVYLAWSYWTARVRYLDLVEELHGQPHAIEEPAAAHT
jgi:hypothetical protein